MDRINNLKKEKEMQLKSMALSLATKTGIITEEGVYQMHTADTLIEASKKLIEFINED